MFWLMIAEIFPLRIRPKAMAAATVGNWTFNFLISYFFLDLTEVSRKECALSIRDTAPGPAKNSRLGRWTASR
jgi:hypothetical protein